jgi:DNA-binding FadR family transcriptional regulator
VRLASVEDHKKIADAILAGKPQVAANATRMLIQEVLDLIGKEGRRPGKAGR